MDAFENGYRMVATRDVRAKQTDTQSESVVQDIIRESDTPEQALELLDELLASRDLDDSQRLEAINTRELLVFLTDNSELITQLRASNILAKGVGGVVNQSTCFQEIQIPNQDTGTVTVIRVEVPCDSDDGAVGGALIGASDYCFI